MHCRGQQVFRGSWGLAGLAVLFIIVPAAAVAPRPVTLQRAGDSGTTISSSRPLGDCLDVPASACGDPHFKGFDGTPFEFKGSHGGSYNLLSEQDHQINARFVQGARLSSSSSGSSSSSLPEREAPTWMDEIVFKHKTDMLRVKITPGGTLSVLVNGEPLKTGAGSVTRQQLPSGARFAFRTQPTTSDTSTSSSRAGNEPRLVVVTPSMSVAIRGMTAPQRHVDVLILAISPYLCTVHGILGQTYRRMYTDGEAVAQAPFALEGAEWDYEVADIMSDQFLFNRFNVVDEGCGNVAGGNDGEGTPTTASASTGSSSDDRDAGEPLSKGTIREQKQLPLELPATGSNNAGSVAEA